MKEEGGSQVTFNQMFTFGSNENELTVTVMDDDMFADDTIGEGTINVAQYRSSPYPQNGTYRFI